MLELRVDPDALAGVVRAPVREARADAVDAAVRELLESGLQEAIRGKNVALLVSDATRAEPRDLLLPPLLEALSPARSLETWVCTGTHDPRSADNVALARALASITERAGLGSTVRLHDARRDATVLAGKTRRGTPVDPAAGLAAADVLVVVSDMKPHYFAGYSNPVKYLVPGLTGVECARANHSLVLSPGACWGAHPWHPDPGRRGNPVAEDMVEAFELALAGRPCFALVTVSSHDRIVWAGGGTVRETAARGMLAVDRTLAVEVEPQRYLVVSAGGHPYDESLYTAQRALELSRAALEPGGEVLFLARCRNGVGPEQARANFLEPLAQPLEDVLALADAPYVLYQHKAWKLADYRSRLARIALVSELPPEDVRRVHLEPVEDPQTVLDRWCAERGAEDRILVVDDGAKLALLARGA